MPTRHDSLLDPIRDLQIVRLPRRGGGAGGAQLWAQLELGLPGGMKDRVALRMIEEAEARGDIRPGDTLIESSSGNLAEGLARVGLLKGYRVIIVTDPRLDELMVAKLQALGARLEIVKDYDPVGGWQSSRLRRLREMLDEIPGAYWTMQYDTPANGAAYAGVGPALVELLGPGIGALVGTVGSGGSLCGIAASLAPLVPGLKVVAVDAVGSVLFHQPDRRRLQSGHSNSIVPGNVRYERIHEVHWLSDGEAFHACRELARAAGVFGGGSSGAAWLVASWVAGRLAANQHVVTILPDRGDRYAKTIYSDAYLEREGIAGQAAAAEPRPICYGAEVAEAWSYAELPHGGGVPYHAASARRTADLAAELGLTEAALQVNVG